MNQPELRSLGPEPRSPGHSVLVIGVPQLESLIRARTAHYDASFLGIDAGFSNAHLTVLGPWIGDPNRSDLDAVAAIAAAHPPFDFTLEHLGIFPNGVIHLVPDPAEPFTALTSALSSAFPAHPPYGGQFDQVEPHLTVDALAPAGADQPAVTLDSVRRMLGDAIPAHCHADRIDLQWWANHDCRVLHSWPLGTRR